MGSLAAAALAAFVAACMAAAVGTSVQDTAAAAGVPSCASKLVPCGGYLNTTAAPPASCCGPLKEAAVTETVCMCAILMDKAALQAFGVAPEQGLLLAKRCGVTTDASACAKSSTTVAAGNISAGTAASSASTGNAASTVAKPTASGGATHRLSFSSASSLRRPIAMRPPSPPRPLAFPTLDSLAAFLGSRLPASALASWGTAPGTKTLLNLFLELSQGDCVLLPAAAPAPPPPQQHPVVRAVHVATVRIRNRRGAVLMETHQLLSDGTLRSRGARPLSEKMRPGETPEAAAARAVREELGERVRVRILGGAEPRVEERESVSYPGLHARYVLHAVDAEVVEGVPEEGEFETEEAGEHEDEVVVEGAGGAITVKRHYWRWVDDDAEEGQRQSAH
ncbi:hypothetical protein E2562_029076 [Oryza meyeriana var. granulata]|uniref:Bifunctional inhibitor/plant lipid transfer protein/seed storage helical domain-containing protein n=1 Tax=Oryza meyeriana var. granulata TaxID=110450 RepID=A0A6G1CUY9_9ORYZ|nr:hypothetical protein E2562_029076 [Oryza meyeriana var. granulata]